MQPADFEARFLRYVCLSRDFVDAVDASTFGSKMPRADWDFIGNMPVPLPSTETQRAIADYLDRETARIDALVAAKERLLGLLAEKRRALITRAVTRGLNPDAPLRDSGLPWLGPIPAHWEIWKVSHFAAVGNGSTPSRENDDYWTDGVIPWLNSSVVNQDEVTAADQFVTKTAYRECHLPLVKRGSILIGITGQGKTRGRAVVLSLEATINQHLAFITPERGKADSWFLRWTFFAAYEFLRSISDDAGGTKSAAPR
jgi:type I restriction enzyme S subunit